MATIYIYAPTASNSVRTRMLCPDPTHRKQVGAWFTLYYDKIQVSWDCGSSWASEDYYYGHRGPRGGRGRGRQLPKSVWNAWPRFRNLIKRIPVKPWDEPWLNDSTTGKR